MSIFYAGEILSSDQLRHDSIKFHQKNEKNDELIEKKKIKNFE